MQCKCTFTHFVGANGLKKAQISYFKAVMERTEKREREDGDGESVGERRVRRRVDEAKGSLYRLAP